MPTHSPHRPSSVHDLLDPNVPFPGGYEDKITIELPCIRIFEEATGREWTDICLALRGGGEMGLVDLPTRFIDFQTLPAVLWRDYWERTCKSVHFDLMDQNQRFAVQTLLGVYVYFAENIDIAEEAWGEFVSQLEMAAMVAFVQNLRHRAQLREPEEDAGENQQDDHSSEAGGDGEHAEWYIFGIALWASGRWPNLFPRPPFEDEDVSEHVESTAQGFGDVGEE